MTWLVILAVGAGSFVFRLGPLLAFQRIALTERGERVIRHAGTAAITALIMVSTKHSATGTRSCRPCWRWRRPPSSPHAGPRCCASSSAVAGSTLARSSSSICSRDD